jgi:hypothetical protein
MVLFSFCTFSSSAISRACVELELELVLLSSCLLPETTYLHSAPTASQKPH